MTLKLSFVAPNSPMPGARRRSRVTWVQQESDMETRCSGVASRRWLPTFSERGGCLLARHDKSRIRARRGTRDAS